MRKRWITSLALSLGILAAGARADDSWSVPAKAAATAPARDAASGWGASAPVGKLTSNSRPSSNPQQSWATPGTAANNGWGPPSAGPSLPAVRLGKPVATLQRPVPLAEVPDSFVKQASFQQQEQAEGAGGVRGQSAGPGTPRPMPLGPTATDPSSRMFVWEPASPQHLPQQTSQIVQPEVIPLPRPMTMPPAPNEEPIGPPPSSPGGPPTGLPGTSYPASPPGISPGVPPSASPGVIVSQPHHSSPVYPPSADAEEDTGDTWCDPATGSCPMQGTCNPDGSCNPGCCPTQNWCNPGCCPTQNWCNPGCCPMPNCGNQSCCPMQNCCNPDGGNMQGCCNPDGCCLPAGCCPQAGPPMDCCCQPECECCGCYPGHRFYVSGEYLLWWVKGSPLPPLLTTVSAQEAGANAPFTGSLGLPNTQILYGNQSVVKEPRSGARVMAGFWFDDERTLGIEVGGFWLQTITANFSISSDGSRALYRPFFDPRTTIPVPGGGTTPGPRENVEFIATTFPAQPPGFRGNFTSVLRSSLWGAEANLRSNLLCNCDFFLDGILGGRVGKLNEDLTMTESPTLIVAAGGNPAGTVNLIQDRFKTDNTFYGGQIGLVGEVRRGPWSLNMMGKVGLGVTRQVVDIMGSTEAIIPGFAPRFASQGFLAGPNNIGIHSRNTFTVLPEVGVNIGYQVTEHVRLFAGYNLLWWSSVLRPGQQIDRTVNPNLLPGGPGGGPPRPAFVFNSSDFWAQGVTAGIEFRY